MVNEFRMRNLSKDDVSVYWPLPSAPKKSKSSEYLRGVMPNLIDKTFENQSKPGAEILFLPFWRVGHK